ncbi:MAG: hypothetical protein QOH27_4201 [Mycobacterium sp.]|nr:hypothetical protein [Mycobacterium sp.]
MCYSSHEMALSLSPLFRFRAIGSPGAYNIPTQFIDQVGTSYPFTKAAILNIDSSAVVKNGDPPSGAHSDILGQRYHPPGQGWTRRAGRHQW